MFTSFTPPTIVAQMITVAIGIYLGFSQDRKHVYVATFAFNLANVIMNAANNDAATAAIGVCIAIRSFVYIFRDRCHDKKVLWYGVPIAAIAAQLAVGWTNINSPWLLIPTLVPAFVCWYMWFDKNLQRMRIDGVICNILWTAYHAHA